MIKNSIPFLFKRQRRMRYFTLLALFLVCLFFGQIILFDGKKSAKAAIGDEATPYVINQSGFIWKDGTDSYYVKEGGCYVRYVGANQVGAGANGLIVDENDTGTDGTGNNCHRDRSYGRTGGDYDNVALNAAGNRITNRHVRIEGNIVVAMWGDSNQFASLTVAGGAIVTHAPLVYFVANHQENFSTLWPGFAAYNKDSTSRDWRIPLYTPGYYIVPNGNAIEKDFDLNSGALTASGQLKKVSIIANKISVLDGQVNTYGRGYPAANADNVHDWWYQRASTDYYTRSTLPGYAGHFSNAAMADKIPTGLPLDYGGHGGYWARCNTAVPHLGGGGTGFNESGGRATTQKTATQNFYIFPGCNPSTTTVAFPSQTQYGDITNPGGGLIHGPGGGSSGRYDAPGIQTGWVVPGGSGGGAINLTVRSAGTSEGVIELHAASVLTASGENGRDYNSANYAGGGGAGGTIFLNGKIALVSRVNNSEASGGIGGGDGVYVQSDGLGGYETVDSLPLGASVLVKGGNGEINGAGVCNVDSDYDNCGGGGGGGAVILNGYLEQSCHFTSYDGSAIPAECENQDIMINGATLNADEVAVWQENVDFWQAGTKTGSRPSGGQYRNVSCQLGSEAFCLLWRYEKHIVASAGQECHDSGRTECDTKRRFNSIDIVNNGVITHQAVTASDMGQDVSRTNGLIASLADETVGTARWKKVDLEIAGQIILNDGRIDANGKGYPGGGTVNNWCGSGFQQAGFTPAYGFGHGYGPSEVSAQIDGTGAGYGGRGGRGNRGPQTRVGAIYSDNFDFGSGGGGGWDGGSNNFSCARGGNGGGRISIIARSIVLTQASRIEANGGDASQIRGDDNQAGGGGGSGGAVRLTITELNTSWSGQLAAASGGGGYQAGAVGSITGPTATNIFAKGGNAYSGGGGGGGGRIAINKVGNSMTIRKTLVPVTRSGASPADGFNPYSLLVNDRIRVDLYVSNLPLNQTITVTDGNLSNGVVLCRPVVGTIQGGNGTRGISGNSVEWSFAPQNSEEVLSYECIVR